ncbi:hypothetical protein [Paenibacillus donghaensis]|uniref:Uncharacterized protein n=1 Tax=Paenibacillus donghaensis TaxID=414771 RepID=A0A2Z2KMN7_9BACL|nr:hypothetical protein [Paenibacillus donghaensis]ASA24763.1 hypothetical protein B9T62_30805 [Paenibacillus donghaensis]
MNNEATETIKNVDDLLSMLDSLFRAEGEWWDKFYQTGPKEFPFSWIVRMRTWLNTLSRDLYKLGKCWSWSWGL